jgi:hypothetical protein
VNQIVTVQKVARLLYGFASAEVSFVF